MIRALAVITAAALAVAVPAPLHAYSADIASHAPAAVLEPELSWQSAGDSYSSGEGVFGNVGACAQSDDAYGPQAVARLRNDGWPIGSVTFTACTGHLVEDYFNARPDSGDKASLWQWGVDQGGPDPVDVITMSFGGNDIGFADLISDCLPIPDTWTGYIGTVVTSGLSGCDPSEADIDARIDALLDPPVTGCGASRREQPAQFDCDLRLEGRTGSIVDFYYDVVSRHVTDRGALFVVGYPRIFAPVDQWQAWVKVACQGVTRGDTEKLGRVAEHFNDKLREAVDRANWALGGTRIHYIDRLALYRDGQHELCGTNDDWLNGVATTRGGTGLTFRYQSSFHPNAAGHAAIADAVVAAVTSTVERPWRPAPTTTTPPFDARADTAADGSTGDNAQRLVRRGRSVLGPLRDRLANCACTRHHLDPDAHHVLRCPGPLSVRRHDLRRPQTARHSVALDDERAGPDPRHRRERVRVHRARRRGNSDRRAVIW
ncbi:MAG: hypothetical protein QM733_05500 [Ilumatobacteraceae bacterium]